MRFEVLYKNIGMSFDQNFVVPHAEGICRIRS